MPFGAEFAVRCSERLLAEFGSVAAVLAASPERRARLMTEAPAAARHLACVRAAMLHALREEALAGALISGTEALACYLRADIGHRPLEQLRILFLATGNRLLADEVLSHGSIDSALMLPRPIIHRALDLGASGLILVHNHPSGSPEPSRADLSATRDLISACRPLDIIVHDHLIVASGGWVSLRQKGLM